MWNNVQALAILSSKGWEQEQSKINNTHTQHTPPHPHTHITLYIIYTHTHTHTHTHHTHTTLYIIYTHKYYSVSRLHLDTAAWQTKHINCLLSSCPNLPSSFFLSLGRAFERGVSPYLLDITIKAPFFTNTYIILLVHSLLYKQL